MAIKSLNFKGRYLLLNNNKKLSLEIPHVVAIINATKDSFYSPSRFIDPILARDKCQEFVFQGASIIDIGGESSRPGSDPISLEEELLHVIPIIKEIRKTSNVLISVDTTKSRVAEEALDVGANIINDISSLTADPKMAKLVSQYKAGLILMHMLGMPKTMQVAPSYKNCVREIYEFLKKRVRIALDAGCEKKSIIIDPGFGFGKRLEDNLLILNKLNKFSELAFPLLIGTSRKSFLNYAWEKTVMNKESNIKTTLDSEERLGGSIASVCLAYTKGARFFRCHDVLDTVQALKILEAVSKVKSAAI